MSKSQHLLNVGVALLLGISTLGCHSFQQMNDPLLIEPLAEVDSGPSGSNSRELCIETAQSVAAEGHYSEAVKLYERAEHLSENGEAFDLQIANLHAEMGEYENAIERYHSHSRKKEMDASTINDYVWACIGAEQFRRAAEVLEQGRSDFPSDERLKSTSACLAFYAGDEKESLRIFSDLYQLPGAYQNLAVLAIESGDTERASQYLKRAMNMASCPEEAHALFQALENQRKSQGSVADAS
ncbi:MAG: hypothetical protein L7U72_02100 [Rubripirellula sp.]|nr:hypothetical protein [Rubripirellula sp.]